MISPVRCVCPASSLGTHQPCGRLRVAPRPDGNERALHPRHPTRFAYRSLSRSPRALNVKKLQIILLSVFAACLYGVAHDQITARLCLEYFTVAHPPLFHTTSPTLLALCWGVAATAGIGAALGGVLALVSQAGDAPTWSISRLGRYLFLLLAVMAASAFFAGAIGYQLSLHGFIFLPADLAGAIPASRHDRFMLVWFAHMASYLAGLGGGYAPLLQSMASTRQTFSHFAVSTHAWICFASRLACRNRSLRAMDTARSPLKKTTGLTTPTSYGNIFSGSPWLCPVLADF